MPKSRSRAVEKLYRCYRMDASRLLDCCRQVVELSPDLRVEGRRLAETQM